MKQLRSKYKMILPAVLCLGMIPCLAGAASAKTEPSKPASAPPGTAEAKVIEAPIPVSVFVVPSSPKHGRDPFFPDSQRNFQKAPGPEVVDRSAIVLNGITSPPKPTAMINGRTFEEGETGEIRLPNGARLAIVCLQIGLDNATIEVSGQRRELRLRVGI